MANLLASPAEGHHPALLPISFVKQVLRDGKHFADACDTAAAELIANTLNLALDRCPPLVGV